MFQTNLKIAFRNLWRNKAYSTINIGGLSLGLASCLLLLLYVHYEWSFNKQFDKADRLYTTYTNQFGGGQVFSFEATPGPLADGIKQHIPGVKATARVASMGVDLLTYKDQALKKNGIYTDPSFLDMFNYTVLAGNRATMLNNPNSIVLTESTARALFGTTDVLNKEVKLNNKDVLQVTGIVADPPRNSLSLFEYIAPWKLLEANYDWIKNTGWGNNFCNTMVELEPNTDVNKVNVQLRPMINANQQDYNAEPFLFLLAKQHLYGTFENGKSVGGAISQVRIFTLLAFCILLIACVNFMNLSTARSGKRSREVGIRKAVGSSRKALINQFLGESMVIAVIAMIVAVVLVEVSIGYFNSLLGVELNVNYHNWPFWTGLITLTLLTGLIAGSYPAFYLSSFIPVKVLKGQLVSSKSTLSVRKGLVVLQFVFAIVLIIGTAIIYRQIKYVQNRPSGYNRSNLVEISLEGELGNKIDVLKDQLVSSGIAVAACPLSISLTRGGNNGWGVSWPGKSPTEQVLFDNLSVNYDFAKTTGINLVAGRDFSREMADSFNVLVNASGIKAMHLKDPIGKMISYGVPVKIIGVFDDFIKGTPYQRPNPMIVALGATTGGAQSQFRVLAVKLNPSRNLSASVDQMKQIVKQLNPAYPPAIKFVESNFEAKFANEQVLGKLANLFGGLSIFICCLGLFGLSMFTAEQRTKEIGIRKVLGASLGNLMYLLSKDFLVLVIIALFIASPIGYLAMNSWLKKFEFKVSIGWSVFVLAFGVALLVAVLSVIWQAWRVAAARPLKALKYE